MTRRVKVASDEEKPPGGSAPVRVVRAAEPDRGGELSTVRCPCCRHVLVPRQLPAGPVYCCLCPGYHPEELTPGAWVNTGIDLPPAGGERSTRHEYLMPEPQSPRKRAFLMGVKP